MNVYTRLGVHDLTGALDGLPNTKTDDDSQRHVLRATGTDDAAARSSRDSSSSANVSNLARRMINLIGKQPTHVTRYAMRRSATQRDMTMPQTKIPPAGFEPATYALGKHLPESASAEPVSNLRIFGKPSATDALQLQFFISQLSRLTPAQLQRVADFMKGMID